MQENYNFIQDTKRNETTPCSHSIQIDLALDREIIDWFQSKVNESEGMDYHQLINQILQEYVTNQDKTIPSN